MKYPSVNTLARLAVALGGSMDWLTSNTKGELFIVGCFCSSPRKGEIRKLDQCNGAIYIDNIVCLSL